MVNTQVPRAGSLGISGSFPSGVEHCAPFWAKGKVYRGKLGGHRARGAAATRAKGRSGHGAESPTAASGTLNSTDRRPPEWRSPEASRSEPGSRGRGAAPPSAAPAGPRPAPPGGKRAVRVHLIHVPQEAANGGVRPTGRGCRCARLKGVGGGGRGQPTRFHGAHAGYTSPRGSCFAGTRPGCRTRSSRAAEAPPARAPGSAEDAPRARAGAQHRRAARGGRRGPSTPPAAPRARAPRASQRPRVARRGGDL